LSTTSIIRRPGRPRHPLTRHRERIYRKFGITSRAELVLLASQLTGS